MWTGEFTPLPFLGANWANGRGLDVRPRCVSLLDSIKLWEKHCTTCWIWAVEPQVLAEPRFCAVSVGAFDSRWRERHDMPKWRDGHGGTHDLWPAIADDCIADGRRSSLAVEKLFAYTTRVQ
jgi:hypothetical protein